MKSWSSFAVFVVLIGICTNAVALKNFYSRLTEELRQIREDDDQQMFPEAGDAPLPFVLQDAPRPAVDLFVNPVLKTAGDASVKFAWDSYRALGIPANENVFFSPYSIMNALGMLALGSAGSTQSLLETTLRANQFLTSEIVQQGMRMENEKLLNEHSADFGVANKFFVDRASADNVDGEYLNDLMEIYNSSMRAINFSTDPSKSRKIINDFVSLNTRGKIENFLPSDLPAETQLVLVNAIYFRGRWEEPFNPRFTKSDDFYVSDSLTATVPFMFIRTNFSYAFDPNLGVETVIVPYEDSRFAMHIIIPTGRQDLNAVENSLTYKHLQRLDRNARLSRVELNMPKFSLKSSLSLKQMMSGLNASDIFNPFKSDYSRIFLKSRPGFFVDDVLHEALVEVDEEGTTAAAATAIVTVRVRPSTKVLTLNRPFLFYIADESSGYVLFWGRYANPLN